MKVIKFIKDNWTDPVWSKVFASGIIAALYSIYKLIPIEEIYDKSKHSYLTISYFQAIILLIITLLIMSVINNKSHLKKLKLSSKFLQIIRSILF